MESAVIKMWEIIHNVSELADLERPKDEAAQDALEGAVRAALDVIQEVRKEKQAL